MFGPKKPNYLKLRTNLRLTINRLKLLEKKKTELALKARKEIAEYIKIAKDDRARIRVEHIIREDYLVEAMEIVEMFCDLLLARFGMIEKMTEMDPGLEEAIATLFWVTPRMSADVQELREVSNHLMLKYGKEFALACQSNALEKVNEKVLIKMSVSSPPKKLIEQYMIEIARTFDVPFTPDETSLMEDELAAAQNLLDFEFAGSPPDMPRPPDGKPPGNWGGPSGGPPGNWGGGGPPGNWGGGGPPGGPPSNWGGGGGGGHQQVPPDLFMPVGDPSAGFNPPPQAHHQMPPPGYSPAAASSVYGGPPMQPGPPSYTPPASTPPPSIGFGAPPPLPAQPPAGGSVPSGCGPPKPPRTMDNPMDPRETYNGTPMSPPPAYPSDSPPPPQPPPRDNSSSFQPSNKPVPAPRGNPPPPSNNVPGNSSAGNDFLANLPSVPSDSVRSAADDIDFDDLTKRFEELKKKK